MLEEGKSVNEIASKYDLLAKTSEVLPKECFLEKCYRIKKQFM
jgi:hypothetical protein